MSNPFNILSANRRAKLIQELEHTNKMIQLYHRLVISLMDCRFFTHSLEDRQILESQQDDALIKEKEYRDRRCEILEKLGVIE